MDAIVLRKIEQLEQAIMSGDVDGQRDLYKALQKAGYEDEAANVHRIAYNKMYYTEF